MVSSFLTGAPSLTGGRTKANILDQGHVADRGGGAAFFFLLPEKATQAPCRTGIV